MEQVFVIAKTSFISATIGNVSRKQKLLLSANLAKEFVAMGLVDYADGEKSIAKKSNQSQKAQTDGEEVQSASLPVETASRTLTLKSVKKDKELKTGE